MHHIKSISLFVLNDAEGFIWKYDRSILNIFASVAINLLIKHLIYTYEELEQ